MADCFLPLFVNPQLVFQHPLFLLPLQFKLVTHPLQSLLAQLFLDLHPQLTHVLHRLEFDLLQILRQHVEQSHFVKFLLFHGQEYPLLREHVLFDRLHTVNVFCCHFGNLVTLIHRFVRVRRIRVPKWLLWLATFFDNIG